MSKTTNSFQIRVCLRIAGVLLICALSFMLLASILLTVCIQNEYINITHISIVGCIMHTIAGYVGAIVTARKQKECGIWEIFAAIAMAIFLDLALVSLIFDGVSMEWGWGILCLLGGYFLAIMVRNHKNTRPKKSRPKYRAR